MKTYDVHFSACARVKAQNSQDAAKIVREEFGDETLTERVIDEVELVEDDDE